MVPGGAVAVDEVYEQWHAKEVTVVEEPHDEVFGRTFVVADPDGNLIVSPRWTDHARTRAAGCAAGRASGRTRGTDGWAGRIGRAWRITGPDGPGALTGRTGRVGEETAERAGARKSRLASRGTPHHAWRPSSTDSTEPTARSFRFPHCRNTIEARIEPITSGPATQRITADGQLHVSPVNRPTDVTAREAPSSTKPSPQVRVAQAGPRASSGYWWRRCVAEHPSHTHPRPMANMNTSMAASKISNTVVALRPSPH